MELILQKILDLENQAKKLNENLYAIQTIRIDITVDLALFKLELKTTEIIELDIDLVESELIFNNYLSDLIAEKVKKDTLLESKIEEIGNL